MAAETKAGTLRIIGEELEALRKRIIANHEAAGQVASGRTKGSLKVEMSEDGGSFVGQAGIRSTRNRTWARESSERILQDYPPMGGR